MSVHTTELTGFAEDETPVALEWITISGVLNCTDEGIPLPGETIYILVNGSQQSQTVTTDGSGAYAIQAQFEEGHYNVQTWFAGDATHLSAYSPLIVIDAWRPTTGLTIDADPPDGSPPFNVTTLGRITRGDTGAGIQVQVEFYRNDVLLDQAFADTGGYYSFSDTITESGLFRYHTEFDGNLMFQGCRSVDAVVSSDVTVQTVAEIDLYLFRLPGATDQDLKTGAVERCNLGFEQQGEYGLNAVNPRLSRLNWVSWKVTVDVTEAETPYAPPVHGFISLVTWGLICYLIAGILIGWLITKEWIYRVIIRPKDMALQDVANSLTETMAWVEDRRAAGDIDDEFANDLNTQLQDAADKAEDAGDDPEYDWVDFIAQMGEWMKYIPWVVGGLVGITVLNLVSRMVPRRRD